LPQTISSPEGDELPELAGEVEVMTAVEMKSSNEVF
jgi:hypothetical protein